MIATGLDDGYGPVYRTDDGCKKRAPAWGALFLERSVFGVHFILLYYWQWFIKEFRI